MKVIFLDIDWVLIRIWKWLLRKWRHQKRTWWLLTDFNEDLVLNLKHLIKETWAKVVISSAWRHDMERTKKSWLEAWLDWDWVVIWRTPSGLWHWRWNEILTYIFDFNENILRSEPHIDTWIAIDDDSADMKVVNRLWKFIHCRHFDWLTIEKIKEAINLLK